jgi:hypothetical protein
MAHRMSSMVAVAIFGLAGLLSGPACSKKAADTGWKADIEVVNGVKTIRNPKTPRYGTFAFDLVEDLAIGDEKDDNYFFPDGMTISIAADGDFYVCDYGNKRVEVYDKNGLFIRTLGRVGQGPGEYRFPSSVLLDESGNVLIDDARSLIVFDHDGLFLRKTPLKTLLTRMMAGPGGTFVGTAQLNPRAEGGPKNELVQLGREGERLRTLAEFPASGVVDDLAINHWYTGHVAFCLRSTDSLFYGYSLDYAVHVVDSGGRPLLVFSKAEDPVSISAEEKGLTRKRGVFSWSGRGDPEKTDLGMPDHRPFFSGLMSDNAGRLYVVRFRPITEMDVTARDVDVFSRDGLYLYRMTWPFIPQVIKGGFLYEVRQDEEAGLTRIIRHRIKNWGEFKGE